MKVLSRKPFDAFVVRAIGRFGQATRVADKFATRMLRDFDAEFVDGWKTIKMPIRKLVKKGWAAVVGLPAWFVARKPVQVFPNNANRCRQRNDG